MQIIVEEGLNAMVGGAKIMSEQPVFFARLSSHRRRDFGEFRVAFDRHRLAADERKLDVDVRDEVRRQFAVVLKLKMFVVVH